MAVTKKQVMRLIRFVAELKNNSYPNASTFAEKLRNADIEENLNISCNARTVQRDIKSLKQDFKAPIKYDPDQNGYYLTRKTWELHCPALCEDLTASFMIASKLAEDIVPQPIKNEITNAMLDIKANSNSDFLDKCFMESLIIASGTKALVNPDIFKTIFDGWRNQEVVNLEYQRPDERRSTNEFEPHIISFHKGIWYSKGIFVQEDREVVLAIQRVKSAALTNRYFEIDKKLIEKVKRNGLFNFEKIKNIEVQCDHSIAFYLYEHQKKKKFKITPQKDGTLIVKLAPAIEHDVIRWILGEGGKVRVLKPEWLRKKVASAAQKIVTANS
jgi:predicted DNA-binding transcriptional regulator YafY